jgi:hypothetical protein
MRLERQCENRDRGAPHDAPSHTTVREGPYTAIFPLRGAVGPALGAQLGLAAPELVEGWRDGSADCRRAETGSGFGRGRRDICGHGFVACDPDRRNPSPIIPICMDASLR